MGRYAQARRRGGDRADRLVTVPTLFSAGEDGIFWDYTGPQPLNWVLEFADSFDGPFNVLELIPGATLTFNIPSDASSYRVAAVGLTFDPIGPYSNVITWNAG